MCALPLSQMGFAWQELGANPTLSGCFHHVDDQTLWYDQFLGLSLRSSYGSGHAGDKMSRVILQSTAGRTSPQES